MRPLYLLVAAAIAWPMPYSTAWADVGGNVRLALQDTMASDETSPPAADIPPPEARTILHADLRLADAGKVGHITAAPSKIQGDVAETPPKTAGDLRRSGPGAFVDNVALIPWETAALVSGTLALGFADWNWGTSSFRFVSEGFFGKDTYNGGMDKLGHAYGSAVMADFFAARINRKSQDTDAAALTGSILSFGVMMIIEIFDGISGDHGFAWQDIVMNTTGVTYSYFRNTSPEIKRKVDFRLEYVPSGYDSGFSPHSDYPGQKYVLALKLSGFDGFEKTPLRFFELQVGYFTEGFKQQEADALNIDRSRHPYVAVGLNIGELLFGRPAPQESPFKSYGRTIFRYMQVPYTYIASDPNAYNY